jgi:hypothetical protein
MATNLITKAEYKAYAGLNSVNQDTEIDLLIIKVSELVKTYCHRTFIDYYDEAKTEVFQGGFKELLLKETPVVNIVSVNYSADYGQTYTKLTKFTDWVQKEDSVLAVNPSGFTEKINGYKVVYFAGYEKVPADLSLSVMDLITYYRNHDVSIHSTKTPGSNSVQIEYISTTSLPAHIKRVLDLYTADYT